MTDQTDSELKLSAAILDAVAHRVSENKAELTRRLHECDLREGRTRTKESCGTAIKRAYREGYKSGLTPGQRSDLLELLGYVGSGALEQFKRECLAPSGRVLIDRLHETFTEAEAQARAYRDIESGFGTQQIFGSVIELRRFRAGSGKFRAWGLPASEVQMIDTGFRFEPAAALQVRSLSVGGNNGKKWILSGIEPPDLDDAFTGSATLKLVHTDYYTVAQCDPSIYHDYAGASEFRLGDVRIDNAMRRANRERFGCLNPRRSAIPYCLTLFYTLILEDKKVLFMRRREDVKWFPLAYEFSGGEQLKPEDLESNHPFAAWMKRAVREEYLAAKVGDAGLREEFEKALHGNSYLSGLGFDTVTCSFPLFGLCQARCTEFEYLKMYAKARKSAGVTSADNEGAIAIIGFDQIAELIERGRVRARVLKDFGEKAAFEEEIGGKSIGRVTLSPETLHPMAAYRLALLAECIMV